MKIHIWPIIKYSFLLLLIIFFVLVFKQNYLVFLLFPYVLLPVVLIPVFTLNVKKVHIDGGTLIGSAEQGNNIIFFVEYKNPTYLPYLKCSLEFSLKNLYRESKRKNMLNFNIFPQKTDKVNLNVATSGTGMVVFEGKTLEIGGFLGMVSYTTPVTFSVQVPVYPVSEYRTEAPEVPYSEGYDEYTEPDLKGSLSSDVKEIREYRPGDRLARIHWKLSAKMEELAVKEMERTSVMSLVIVPELEKTRIDETIDTLNMISRELADSGERFEISLFNSRACSFDYYMIDNEESLLNCYGNMYLLPLYEGSDEAKEAYFASHQKSTLMLSVYGREIKLLEDGIEVKG